MSDASPLPPAATAPLRRGLVVAPSWIGDALLAQPLLARIHALHPGITLDALAVPWTAAVLARMPEIARVVPSPFAHGDLKLRERFRLGRSLAAERYDAAWVLPNTIKSALVPFFAGIRRRIGYTGESRYVVLNVRHVLEPLAVPLMAERYAQLAEPPGAPVHRPLAAPRLRVDEANRNRAIAELGLNLDRPVVVFCPGAEYGPAKRWPPGHYAALAQALQAAHGVPVLLLGSGKEAPLCEQIAASAGDACRVLAGRTTLAEAIALIAASRGMVSNDSGLMHVAAAFGIPQVAPFGSTSPEHTPPLNPRATVIWLKGESDLGCIPCFDRECRFGHTRCLADITPQRVQAALERQLADVEDGPGRRTAG